MLQITEKTPLADLYNKARAAGLRTTLNSSKASIGINGGSLGVKAQLGLITDTLDVELAGRPGSSECHGTVTSGKKGTFLITADEAGKLFAEPEKKPEDTAEQVQEEAPAAPAAEKPGKDAGEASKAPAPAPAPDRAKAKSAGKSPAVAKAEALKKPAEKAPQKESPREKTKELPAKAPAVIPEGSL